MTKPFADGQRSMESAGRRAEAPLSRSAGQRLKWCYMVNGPRWKRFAQAIGRIQTWFEYSITLACRSRLLNAASAAQPHTRISALLLARGEPHRLPKSATLQSRQIPGQGH